MINTVSDLLTTLKPFKPTDIVSKQQCFDMIFTFENEKFVPHEKKNEESFNSGGTCYVVVNEQKFETSQEVYDQIGHNLTIKTLRKTFRAQRINDFLDGQ